MQRATDVLRPCPCLVRHEIESLPNESETMTTYLTLVGMLLLVVSPVLIAL